MSKEQLISELKKLIAELSFFADDDPDNEFGIENKAMLEHCQKELAALTA